MIAFGSLLAMAVPIVVAIAGIAVGLPIIGLLTHVYPLQSFATTLATMIGIGVGIDYALFVVTRYRQGLQAGLDPEEAVITAIDTSGRAVLFAGLTVIIALLGMSAIGLSFISGLGIGAAAFVAVTVAAAVTLLPAVLGFVGTNIDKWRLPWVHDDGDGSRETIWHRWSRVVQRPRAARDYRRLGCRTPARAPRAVAAPRIRRCREQPVRFANASGLRPAVHRVRPGIQRPVVLAIEFPSRGNHQTQLAGLHAPRSLRRRAWRRCRPPSATRPERPPSCACTPRHRPRTKRPATLLHHLRRVAIPQASRGSGAKVYVGGFAALTDDFAISLGQRLPLFIGVVILLSFLLLMAVFRSILVPLKAAYHEPAVRRRGVRRDRDDLPVRVGQRTRRRPQGENRFGRIPIMMFAILFGAFHGLRGVPAFAHPLRNTCARATTVKRSPTDSRPPPG